MFLYAVLWGTSNIPTFLLLYPILATLRNRVFPSEAVSSLRDATRRNQSRANAAHRIDQLLTQKNPAELLGTLKTALGPAVQLQLNDAASLLECVNNCAEWARPRATAATLALLAAALAAGLLAGPARSLHAALLGAGALFFGAFPVASRCPQYRLLVSPARMALCGAPTHAEWAFAELRAEARRADPDPGAGAFRCRAGTLHIAADGVWLERARGGGVAWRKRWPDLVEMRKVRGDLLGKLVGGAANGIEMIFLTGVGDAGDRVVRLDDMGKGRDRAFCRALGMSGLRWQWCAA